jgi:hypothetical protein
VTDRIGGADDALEAAGASEAQAWRLGSDPVEQPGPLRTITAVGLEVGPDPAHALIELGNADLALSRQSPSTHVQICRSACTAFCAAR